jgi:hypothetical protein
MPTGYTQIINDKPDTTFGQFTLRCARAMGALIMLRDEPMDAPIPDNVGYVSTYHAERVQSATDDLVKYSAMDDEDCEIAAEKEYKQALADYRERMLEKKTQARNYGAMLGQVLAWKPPTAEHKGMKEFMEKQLRESIEFDCYTPDKPVKQSGPEWKAAKIASAIHSLDYSTKSQKEDEERNKGRNEWIKALRDNLDDMFE